VRLEGLGQSKNLMTSSGIETATFIQCPRNVHSGRLRLDVDLNVSLPVFPYRFIGTDRRGGGGGTGICPLDLHKNLNLKDKEIHFFTMIIGSLLTRACRVLGLRMEETASRYGGQLRIY
jgi:hypothetical protein